MVRSGRGCLSEIISLKNAKPARRIFCGSRRQLFARHHKLARFAAKINIFLMNGGNGCVLGVEIRLPVARAGFGGFKRYYFSMHRQGFQQ